jgi:ankyrin repeat protein
VLPDGQTLLHVVAWEGHARLVALLVREGVSMNVRIAAGTPPWDG